jgi:deazaflavin-dependent oxidoreductase (nitroreductase family)
VNAAQSAVQGLAGSAPGAWLLRGLRIDGQDRLLDRMTGGRTTVSGVLAGLPTVFVTTSGRRTGRPHTVPLTRISDPERPDVIGLIGSNFGRPDDPDWALNLRAHPAATVHEAGSERAFTAVEVVGGEPYERWFVLGAAVYRGFGGYRRRAGRHVPVFELTPRGR